MSAAILENSVFTPILAFAVSQAYWAALGLGGTVLVGSLLLGGLSGGTDADGDAGSGGFDVAGETEVDATGDHDAGIDASHPATGSAAAPGILSPMMLAFFLVCSSLVGLMLTEWQSHWGNASVLPATGAGLVLSLFLRRAVRFLYAGADGGNEPRSGDEIGVEADVLSFVSRNGLGTIAYVVRGMRYTRAARSATEQEFKTGDRVVITRSEHNVCTVAPCSDRVRQSGGPEATGS